MSKILRPGKGTTTEEKITDTFEDLKARARTIPLHHSVTFDRIEKAAKKSLGSLGSLGFCIACGSDVEGVEPDAQRYECRRCGIRGVYGAEEILIQFL